MSQIAANMLIERALESHLLKVRSTSSLSRSPSSISNFGNTSFSSTEENEKVLNFEHGKGKSIFDVLKPDLIDGSSWQITASAISVSMDTVEDNVIVAQHGPARICGNRGGAL